ncbi:MAG: glycerophosphodiester phosphodiesterase family protein [Bacteroidetes bacterium]|nr:glycerophosphodiester phosphodiesterase family protein [Bacteroidota bacterium]
MMRPFILILASIITIMRISVGQQRATLPFVSNKIVVIAHRGDHVDVPENTIAAYEKAIEHGADFIETDLRTTKDGELVIMHDASVDRMTNGKGKVNELSYKEIKELKITDKHKQGLPVYTIPTFKEVLNTCKGKTGIYLDFKDADPAKVYTMIREAGMEKNVVIYLNKEEQYYEWKKVAPEMPLMSSPPENAKDSSVLQQFLAKWDIAALDGSVDEYTDEMLKTTEANHVAVWLDVQSADEGPDKWNRALQKGIRGLQTDHPEKLIRYLKEKNLH